MFRTEQEDQPQAHWTGSKFRQAPAGVSALFVLLIVACFAVLVVACGDDPSPTPVPGPTAAPEPTPEPAPLDDDALTRAYVTKAVDYYKANGLDATVALYKSQAGTESGRTLILVNEAEGELLVYRNIPALEGQYVGPGSGYSAFSDLLELATEEGYWITTRGINPATKQEEPRRVLVVLHDGLVFSASHSALVEDVANSVKEYVDKAIAKYQEEGLDAVISHYNGQDSLDGQLYLFLIAADDNYLAHPIFPHLIGSDIKAVVGSDGQELGKEIAQATEEGVWVEYLWPHPVTLREVPKVGYAVRHDGMLFASGYYPQVEDPAARTKEYVQQAIEYYQANGLDATIAHYNSRESLDGQWGLTMADENDVVRVAVLAQNLVGTDLKDVGAYRIRKIGEELAAATEDGIWVSFVFPNTRSSETLYAHAWAIRHDGLLFTSRYYDDRSDVPDTP